MANAVSPIPEGIHTIAPHLIVNGASGYMDFLKRAFGAVGVGRAPGPGGKIIHAWVLIGNSLVMLNDHFSEFGVPAISQGFWPVALHRYVPDADAVLAQVTPAGFRWSIATRKKMLTFEEIQRRQDKLLGKVHPA